jgi:hypothetical protein
MKKILLLGIFLLLGGCGSFGENKQLSECQKKLKEAEAKLMACTLYYDDCVDPQDRKSLEIKGKEYHW